MLAIAVFAGFGSPAAVAATKPTKSPLVIGSIYSTSGPCLNAQNFDVPNTENAWASYVNSHGGIAGHPVKVEGINDNCDGAQSSAAAQKLIADHALAIIDGTNSDSSWIDAVTAASIPIICGIESGNSPNCFLKPNLFPTGTTVLSELYGNVAAAKKAGAKSYGTWYCTENPACAQAVPLFKSYAAQVGVTYATPLAVSEVASSYTAQCLVFKQQNVEALFPAGPPQDKVADDCARQGYHPIILQAGGSWLTRYAKDPSLNGSTGTFSNVPWFLHVKATKVFRQVEKKELANAISPYNVSGTWGALNAFTRAANHGSHSNPTTADIYDGLYSLSGTNLGGFGPTVTYTRGKPPVVNCYFIVSIKNRKFVAPQGTKTDCQPPPAS